MPDMIERTKQRRKEIRKKRIIQSILLLLYFIFCLFIMFIKIVVFVGLIFAAIYFCMWIVGYDLMAILSKLLL